MSTLTIRRFRPRDLRGVVAIERRSFGVDAWPADLFVEYAEHCAKLFTVVDSGRSIVAYSIACLHREHAELVSLAVAPRMRNRGIAGRLLGRALRATERAGARSMWLMVRVDNGAAIRLYGSFGFKRERKVRGYYEDGADGLRMCCRYAE